MTPPHEPFLGIDLGTTSSAAALFDGDRIDLVRNAQGAVLTPSIVRIDARGRVSTGARARRFLESDPDNTARDFKRLMGTDRRLAFPAAGVSRTPEELAAEVLRSLLEDAREQTGSSFRQAVVAVPALFELPQAAGTSGAAAKAGLERVELIQEPVASALGAGWDASSTNGDWLVYDLGGGTFDVSLLRSMDQQLMVMGHDGDNFLGGRDIDTAIVDWLLEILGETHGRRLTRGDSRLQGVVGRLRGLAEEAKIELTRREEADILVGPMTLPNGDTLEDEVQLRREDLDRLALPVIDRTLRICERLLEASGTQSRALERVVLVGGPSVMPLLRRRVGEVLGAPIVTGLDPMTLVARGAAIYAATVGLTAAPKAAGATAVSLLLDYPSMTSDPEPIVVGRIVSPDALARIDRVKLTHADGPECSEADVDEEGVFSLCAKLCRGKANRFDVTGLDARGRAVVVHPASFVVLHGMTLDDPPLSRSVGVALANDRVRVYLERGVPLPAKRRFSFETVESTFVGERDCVLRIPIVQGEYEAAHLCRLVGALELRGDQVEATIPRGSVVELTIEVDRGGRLSARAYVPSIDRVFEHVESLLVPEASPEALARGVEALEQRLADLRAAGFRHSLTGLIAGLAPVDEELDRIRREAGAARGGDVDAAQKAMRGISDIDALLDDLDAERHFPQLEAEAVDWIAVALSEVSSLGTESEQRLLDESIAAIQKARQSRSVGDMQRQLRIVRRLYDASYYRRLDAWTRDFEQAVSLLHDASDLRRANELARQGRRALLRNDQADLRRITIHLWELLPVRSARNRHGHRSGVL